MGGEREGGMKRDRVGKRENTRGEENEAEQGLGFGVESLWFRVSG